MSYVLDALRRADAERDRGAVPDLHAHVSPSPGDESPGGARRYGWIAALGAVALALLLALAWLLWSRSDGAPTAPTAPTAGTAPVPARTEPVMPAVPAAAAPTPPQVLIRIEAPAAMPAPAPARSDPTPAASRAVKLQELPEALRRQLPAMAFGGAMDSPVASSRMLIINGQVFREGESPGDGLVLERIHLRSAVFSLRGQRFELAY